MVNIFSILIHTFNWIGKFLQPFCESTTVNDGEKDSILFRLWDLESETSEAISFKLSSVCCLCFGIELTIGLEWSLDCKEDPECTKFKQWSCCLLFLKVLGLITILDSVLSFTLFSSSLESSSKKILDNFFFERAQFCPIFICFSFTERRVLNFFFPFAKQSSVIKLKSTDTSSLDWLLQDSSSLTQKLSSK